jgi:hypothetical protein
MKTFKDLNFKPHPYGGGMQAEIKFGNGFGASIIRREGSYGYDDGLWELAVKNSSGSLDYSTPVTDDVLGYLTEDDVTTAMQQIENLLPE